MPGAGGPGVANWSPAVGAPGLHRPPTPGFPIAGAPPAGSLQGAYGGPAAAGQPAAGAAGVGPDSCPVSCFDKEPVVTGANWRYVGAGKGAYSKLQNYSFVGEGVGSFDKEMTTTYYGWRLRKCCIGCLLFLCLASALYLLATYLQHRSERPSLEGSRNMVIVTPPPSEAPQLMVTPVPYNCTLSPGVEDLSPALQRDWCCKNFGLGCTTLAPQPETPLPTLPQTTPITFDCQAGRVNWVRGWSFGKKQWCCAHRRVACHVPPPPPTTSLPFNCDADYVKCQHCLEIRWSVAKRDWCCHHAGKGCPAGKPVPRLPPTSLPFDCAAGLSEWSTGWSTPKMQWCCQHFHKGCATPPPKTTSLPYDCNADFTTCYQCLERRWSTGKRAWCCKHTGRGCSTTTELPSYECDTGREDWIGGWSEQKKAWCCAHEHKGCQESKDASTTTRVQKEERT